MPDPARTETDWRNDLASGDRVYFPDGCYADGRARPLRSATILRRLRGGWAQVRFDDSSAVENHTLRAVVSRVEGAGEAA